MYGGLPAPRTCPDRMGDRAVQRGRNGLFSLYAQNQQDVIVRKELYRRAVPSGNANDGGKPV